MSNKKAKAIRRALKYHPNEKQQFPEDELYRNHIVDVEYDVPIIDIRDGKAVMTGTKKGITQGKVIECVYGPYKEYKMLKKLASNPNYNAQLTMLPSKKEEEALAKEMLENFKRERHYANIESDKLGNSNEENLLTNQEGGVQSKACEPGTKAD